MERLLASIADTEGILDRPAAERAAPFLARDEELVGPDPAPGGQDRRVGPYRLTRELGRGGMGVVYLAERADGEFEHRVAIKRLQGRTVSEEMLGRFRHERQILASLNHPGIARLFDGGVDADGPYFVMEHVEGLPIDRHCERRGLTPEQRLRLFVHVGEAVHAAHQRLVVHRDLKPSNILVTADGQVKLLDFGLAKWVGDEHADGPGVRTGKGWLTPKYAAPEQIRGEEVTTATDVYGLGVVLFKLLTGKLPFRFERASPGEIARVICDEKPEALSAAGPIRSFGRRRGELDAIVQKALAKSPSDRYPTVQALLDDVRRLLGGYPVSAYEASAAYRLYRLDKFVGRHRLGVLAGSLGLLLAVGFAALYAVRVTEERDRAARQALRADTVKDFLIDLFEVSDPDRSMGETISASTLLRRGAERIEGELASQGEVQAELMNTIGVVNRKLGRFAEAERLLERALERRRELFGEDRVEVVESLLELAALRFEEGAFEEAESAFSEAAAILERLREDRPEERVTALQGQARSLAELGRYEQAVPMLRRALAWWRGFPGGGRDAEVASALHDLGTVLSFTGQAQEAATLLEEALVLRRKLRKGPHREIANTLNALGATLGQDLGDLEAAEPYLVEALAIRRQLYGDEHPESVGSLNNLAALQRANGNFAEAERMYRELLPLVGRTLGPNHPHVATVLKNLGVALSSQGKTVEADGFLDEAVEHFRRVLPERHPRLAAALLAQGSNAADGRPEHAEPLLREALRGFLEADAGASGAAKTRHQLGRCLTALARYEEAEVLLSESLEANRRLKGPGHPDTAAVAASLSELYAATGRTAEMLRD